MAIFRRSEPRSSSHPISEFWSWWANSGHAIDPSQQSGTTGELARRVKAIHPDLSWHFGPGDRSKHSLTVSAGGIAEVRSTAERWLRAAPVSDERWEFRSSQQADPNALRNVLQIAGRSIDLSLTEFRIEPVAEDFRVHVGVYHPAFAGLPKPARAQVAFLVLDWLLGEDDVERWLGELEPLTSRPSTAGSANDLSAAVATIAAQRGPDDGWFLLQWQDKEGRPGRAMCQRGLRWIDTPTLGRHQIVSADFLARPNGLPISLDEVREIEAELEARLGSRGILIGHETHRGVRTFHAYTDGEDQNVDAALQEWATHRGLRLESRPDPSWREVRHFTG